MQNFTHYKINIFLIIGIYCHKFQLKNINKYHSINQIQFNWRSQFDQLNCSPYYADSFGSIYNGLNLINMQFNSKFLNCNNQLKGTIEMKAIKHHLVNWKEGKTICGLNFKSDSIRLASNEEDKWFDDFGNELDTSNYQSIFCMSCLKLHELDLIEQFKMESFMIQFDLQLPKSKRLRKAKAIKTKRNRIAGVKSIPKSNPIDTPVESKSVNPIPTNSIPKSTKGLARDKRKAKAKSNPIDTPTESKCKIISKPDKPIEKKKPIELTKDMEVNKPLIDLSNGPVTIETEPFKMENVNPIDDWNVGDPIDDDVLEMAIGDNWKLVRHDKVLDKWQFQLKSVVKGLPKWIADSEWIDYQLASEFILEGYCE
jgi:hypothetical protein